MKPGNHNTENSFYHPFKDLKKLIKKRKKRNLTHDSVKPAPATDEILFTDAMKDVSEIKEFRELQLTLKKKSVERFISKPLDVEAITALEEIVQGKRPVRLSDTPEYIEWVNKDYKDNIATRLHKGHYAIQDCLDLHGVILENAEEEVAFFFRESQKKNLKCIKIIHGRGLGSSKGPVLKDAVVKLLSKRYRKHIVAFVSARQCDGGLGALYVLLR